MVKPRFQILIAAGAFLMLAGPAVAANVQEGATLSKKHCASCHGADGKGNGPALSLLGITQKPIDWTNKAEMSKLTDADLTKITTEGGKAVGKSAHMPGFGKKFSAAQISDIVAYIRSLSK